MSTNEWILKILSKLIQESNATFSGEDVLREFRNTSDRRSDRKLLKVLDIISKNKPKRKEHLAEASRNLKIKDPMYTLISFLNHYSAAKEKRISIANTTMPHTVHNTEIPTSTPFLIRQRTDTKQELCTMASNTVCVEHSSPKTDNSTDEIMNDVLDIKERVKSAAASSHSLRNTSSLASTWINGSEPGRLTKMSTSMFEGYRTDDFWNFHKIDMIKVKKPEIAAVPVASQERLVLTDLIYVLSGVRGCYIKPKEIEDVESEDPMSNFIIKFYISDDVDSSLKDVAQIILPLASYYNCIQKFIHWAQRDNAGQVLQALSSSLTKLTHDYYLLLAQLESELLSNALTFYKFIFYIRPTIDIKEVIANTLAKIMVEDLHGANVLTELYTKVQEFTGDEEAQRFIIDLAEYAAVPYMRILQLWIQKGIIVDPGQDFLVEDNEVIRREELPEHYSADYWEKRYTIRYERIPCFLVNQADIILRTGKYLNVIRQCGQKVTPSQSMNLEFKIRNSNYIKVIDDAYSFATKTLLEVLLKENDLMGHLMSVKRYLLLNQGDFIMQFMDACEEELSKTVDQVLPMALENLLGLTLRLSAARSDPYKDELHCELLIYDLVTQMSKIMAHTDEIWPPHERLDLKGLECFAFTYEVQWPISLVLNHIAISKYQMIFRQLFYCKYVEVQLCKIWKENSRAKKFSLQAAEHYRSAFTLRQRMMNAIQNLEYYMLVEIIEPNWHIFIVKMEKVENVDEVLRLHQDFLDSCLKNCMLTETIALNRSIFKMCNICLKFCEFIHRSQRFFLDAELKSMLCDSNDECSDNSDSSQKQSETSLAPTDTFSERIKRFDLEFTGVLITFLKQINEVTTENTAERITSLVHRMNFNHFYSDQLEKLCAKDAMAPSHKKSC